MTSSSRRALALGLAALLLFSGTLTAQQPVSEQATGSTTATLQSAATANGNGTPLSVDGYASLMLTLNCASCAGGTTVNFEATEDGSTWQLREGHIVNSAGFGSSTTTAGVTVYEFSVAGFTSFRARISGYSAGTVTVTAHAVPMTLQSPAVEANIVAGSVSISGTASTNVAQINGVTPLMGAGNTGTGSARVTIATDQAALAAAGQGATGAAVPSGAEYQGTLAQTALPTAATAGNLTGVMADKFGRQVVLPGTIRDLRACQTTTISASTSETTVITAAGSGVFADPYLILVSNTSASTNTRIDFRDATAGTVLFSLQSVGGSPPAGFVLPQSIPQTTANNNWTAQAATSTTDLRVYLCYEKNK